MKRVLLFARSAPYRAILRRLVEAEHDLAVVAETGRADEALQLAAAQRPAVAVIDLSADGAELDLIETLMRSTPLPILVVTGGDPGADPAAFEVVRRGAVDLMPRPTGGDHAAAARLRQRLRLVAGVPVIRHTRPTPVPDAVEAPPRAAAGEASGARSRPRIIGVAASAGGASAVAAIVARFDGAAFPAAVAIVQHLPDRFAATFASFLRQSAALPVEIVTTRVAPRAGAIFIAADDRHLVAAADGALESSDAPPVGGHRPSATMLFQSLARVFGADAAGVVLSGIGDDGASGLAEMRARGALTIAESQATAAVYGMPRAAIDADAAVEVLPLDAIADRLIDAVDGARA